MQILYISSSRVPSRAANSIHVMKICSAMANNGHEVHLMTARAKKDTEKGVVDVFDFYGVKKNFNLYRLYWMNIPMFSIIYSLNILLIFLNLTLKNRQRPLCFSRYLHGLYLLSFFGPPLRLEMHLTLSDRKFERVIFKKLIKKSNFKKLVVISEKLAEIYINEFPELSNKIVVAHDAADIVDLNEKIQLHGNGKLNLGYVGHLYKGRGVRLMIDLVKNKSDIDLHLIGGTENDIEFWKNESAQFKNVHFYGFKSPKETVLYRNSCDILLAPYEKKLSIAGGDLDTSRWMSPLKIFEYMSAKKPIICSDLPVLREVLVDKQNAILCEPESLDSWSTAVENIRRDSDLSAKIADNAYNDFRNKYTWTQRAKLILAGG